MCFEIATIVDSLIKFISHKENEDKSLLDCAYRFKVARKVLMSHVNELLHFIIEIKTYLFSCFAHVLFASTCACFNQFLAFEESFCTIFWQLFYFLINTFTLQIQVLNISVLL